VVKDELTNALADRLNRNTYVLSVIAAIFLPLGFLTGLMGINLGGIPGAASANAFWIFSAILVVLVVAQVVIFRMLRWF
jgi:zinc transporter